MNARALRGVAVILLAGLIAGWFAALRPELDKRAAIQDEAAMLASRLAAHRAAAAELSTWRDRVEALQQEIRGHPMRLPREPDLPGLLDRVASLATATGVRVVGVEPADTIMTADYRRRPVILRLQGHWDALVELLTRLGHETRAITMSQLGVARRGQASSGPPLALTLTVTGYWQSPEAAPMPTETPPGAGGWATSNPTTAGGPPAALTRNPFQPRAAGPEAASTRLTYLGRIQIGERVWALIRDASGDIHHRQAGATLPGGGRLEQVMPTAVIVNRPDVGDNPGGRNGRLRIGLDDPGG